MEKLAALIPELYYDLIGRFVPGALGTAVFAPSLLALIPEKAIARDFLMTCLALAVAYSAGLVVDAASGMTIRPFNHAVRRLLALLPLSREARIVDQVDPWAFMRGNGDSEARAVVGKLLAERTCIRSLALLWLLVWLTGVPPAGVFGSLGQVALSTLLLTAQYRWEYLARVTAHTYSDAVSRAKAR